MKTVGIFDAKTRLSEICDGVARTGEPVLVTKRGKPLVRIEAISGAKSEIWEARAQYLLDNEIEEDVPLHRSDDLPDYRIEY